MGSILAACAITMSLSMWHSSVYKKRGCVHHTSVYAAQTVGLMRGIARFPPVVIPTRFRQSAALRYCYCITPAHSLSSQFLADTNRIKNNGSALAALAPQAHLFGVGNQLLTEIWVGNVDQGLRHAPRRSGPSGGQRRTRSPDNRCWRGYRSQHCRGAAWDGCGFRFGRSFC